MRSTFGKVLLAGVLAISAGFGSLAARADEVGTIDLEKVLRGYEAYQAFVADQKVREAELRKMQADFVKQLEESRKNDAKNPVATNQLEKNLNEQLQTKVTEYQKWVTSRQDSFETNLDQVIGSVAKSKGVDVVMGKQGIYYGGMDLTADVLRQLNTASAAPAKK